MLFHRINEHMCPNIYGRSAASENVIKDFYFFFIFFVTCPFRTFAIMTHHILLSFLVLSLYFIFFLLYLQYSFLPTIYIIPLVRLYVCFFCPFENICSNFQTPFLSFEFNVRLYDVPGRINL